MLERRVMDLLDTRRPHLVLAAFCLLLWLPGFFTLPPTDRDESRFAQASKQMLETGDFVRIMNGTEPRNRKPIGIYWLQVPFAAAAHATGIATANPIWPYRVPSLLGGLGAVFAVFWGGEALVGRRAGLLAAGMLAASVALVVEVHLAKTDAALLAVTTLAMAVLGRAYVRSVVPRREAVAFWLAVGGGILLKGPITPMVAVVTVVTLAAWDRRVGWLRGLRAKWGVPLMLLVVVPWFVAIGLATHGAFFHDAVGGDLAGKLSSGDDAHGAPPGLHLLLLPLLAFPSSFAVVAAVSTAWRMRKEPATRFLLAWLVPCWLVFEAVPTKLPHYTLPLYPALFLLAAHWCVRTLPDVAVSRWRRLAAATPVLAAFILAGGALAMPAVVGAPLWLGVPVCGAALLTGWLGRERRSIVAGLAAMPLLTLSLVGWELPHVGGLWLAPTIEHMAVAAGLSQQRLGAVGFHEPSLMFLAGTGTDLLPDAVAGAQALATGQVDALVVGDRDEPAFHAAAHELGIEFTEVGRVTGLNYSRGRAITLDLYRR